MILPDKVIRKYVEHGHIEIKPPVRDEQYQPASLDVRIGSKLYRPSDDMMISSGTVHTFEPDKAYIGHTKDYIEMPDDLAAQLTGRSSMGRNGLIIHKTAGWIDCGFCGQITLELYNFGDEPVEVSVGDRVGQLVFFRMEDSPDESYDGQYQGQRGISR